MFTGIISDLGAVRAIVPGPDRLMTIGTGKALVDLAIGASIACNGICLTAIAVAADWFQVQVSAETVGRTTIGGWQEGTVVNLERPLRAGDELGGHLVSGHVDGTARIINRLNQGGSLQLSIQAPSDLNHLIATKGSVALDGVSLTVNSVVEDRFDVNIIPHTQTWTNLGNLPIGALLNIEVDMLARYLDRLLQQRQR